MSLLELKIVTALAVGLCVLGLSYASATAPAGDPIRLGLRGLRRQRLLARSAAWRTLDPVLRWLGRRLRGLMSLALRAKLDRQIETAGDFLGLLPEELLALNLLCVVAGTVLGAVLGKLSSLDHIGTMLGAGYGALGVHLALSNARADRLKSMSRSLPHAIDLLSLSVGAGLDLPGATAQLVAKSRTPDDPLIEELTLLLQSLEIGRTRRQALEELARRAPCDAVSEFVNATVLAELRGTPIAFVLQIQATVARQKRSVRAEAAAAKAGVQLLLPLGLVFLSVLLIVVAPIVVKLSKTSM